MRIVIFKMSKMPDLEIRMPFYATSKTYKVSGEIVPHSIEYGEGILKRKESDTITDVPVSRREYRYSSIL
jgi:hypothetical protein